MNPLMRFLVLLAFPSVLLSGGCAGLAVHGPAAASLKVERIASADGRILPDPSGRRVAVAGKGLSFISLDGGGQTVVDEETPDAFSWNPEGTYLAAAFPAKKGGDSEIRVYAADGAAVASVKAEGRAGGLFWTKSRGILTVSVLSKAYSFGASVTQLLHQWDMASPPVSQVLHENTLKPKTFRTYSETLHRMVSPSVSRYGDEIIYAKIHDPPAFPTDRRFVLRHLETSMEKEIVTLPPQAGAVGYTSSDDTLFISGARPDQAYLYNPWSGATLSTFKSGPAGFAASSGADIIATGGVIYSAAREAATVEGIGEVAFGAGDALFAVSSGTLYKVSGFGAAASTPLTPEGLDRLITLRSWRSRGLISQDDFLSAREKIR